MEKADHGALAAAQIQAVVPVGAQALACPGPAHLSRRKIENPFQMFINRFLFLCSRKKGIRIGKHFRRKSEVARLFDIFRHGAHQPERVIGTGVFQAVHDTFLVRFRNDRRRFERLCPRLFHKPLRLEQMNAVPCACQAAQKLFDAFPAFLRIGMGHSHRVLRRVPVAQADSSSHFDKRSKAGKHHVDFGLVQRPCIDHRVHAFVRRPNLQFREFFFPIFLQIRVDGIHRFRFFIFCTDALSLFAPSFSEHKNEPGFFSRLQRQILLQTAAVIAAFFTGRRTMPRRRRRIRFGIICSHESLPHAVKAVRHGVHGKILIAFFFIKQVFLDDAVLTGSARTVKAHLVILVVDHNMMERKFQIGKNAQIPDRIPRIPDFHIP